MPEHVENQTPSLPIDRRAIIVPLIVGCALFMEILDGTIITTALPVIAESLQTRPLILSLAVTSYLLSLGVFIPLSGWIADRFGSRNIFRCAILVFLLGSLCCALSQNVIQLILSRVLQGLGGAMMVPVGRLLILRTIPRDRLITAMSYLTVPALIGPICGPALGGYIATYSSWRWIFLINIPIGIIGFYLVGRFIPKTDPPETHKPFDLKGWVLIASAIALILGGVECMGKDVLPDWLITSLIVFGLLCLGGYIRHALHIESPVLDLSLMREQTFATSNTGGAIYRMGTGAFMLLLPLMLQLGFGMTPFESGRITLFGAVGAIIMKFTVTPILRKFGFRNILLVNTIISGLIMMLFACFKSETSHLIIIATLLMSGFFRSLQFTCFNTMSYADISDQDMSQATSFSSTTQQISFAVGIALAAQLLNLLMHLSGGETLSVANFHHAFIIIGFGTMIPLFLFRKLKVDAGHSVSGHKPKTVSS
jgi:EmrB/QacA subfamily drug resistance transporter